MIVNLREELASRELKRDIGLLECIDNDEIALFVCCCQEGATILYRNMEIGFFHIEILASNLNNSGIDFNAINGYRAIDLRHLVSNGAASKPDNGDTP